jgi:hypothetical protein
MTRKGNNIVRATARSSLRSDRMRIPEFGARYPFIYDDTVDDFFGDIHGALQVTFPKDETDQKRNGKRHHFRVYDDPARAGISVLERRVVRSQAQRSRFRWSHADAARIRQEICDDLASAGLDEFPWEATFTNAVRVGDADSDNARKIGLIIDQESDVAEGLVLSHEIVINSMRGMLKSFREPYSPYIPHWTAARIDRQVGNLGMEKAMHAVQALLPVTVQLEPITFFTTEEI